MNSSATDSVPLFFARFFAQRHCQREGHEPLAYHAGGSGRRPLVIINAYGQSLAFWDRLVGHLADRFRVVIYQPRGSLSEQGGTALAHAVDGHAQDLLAILDAENIDRAHILAWCTGPKTALSFSKRHPERLASMTLLSGSFIHRDGYRAFHTRYESTMAGLCRMLDQRPQIAGQLTEMMKKVLFEEKPDGNARPSSRSPEVAGWIQRPFQDPEAVVAYARQLLLFWDLDISPCLPDIMVPTLFISGEQDDITHPRLARELAQQVPGAIYAEVAGGSHYLHHDRAALLADMVDRFTASGYGYCHEQEGVRTERFLKARLSASPMLMREHV